MKVLNSGSTLIKIIANGKPSILKGGDVIELDERTYSVLHKLFPALVAKEESSVKEDVIIEAEAQPIIEKPKAKKNGTRKKSK